MLQIPAHCLRESSAGRIRRRNVPTSFELYRTINGVAQFKEFEGTTQEFYIDPWGNASVRKFGNQATRRLDDSRYINGVQVFNNEVRNP